MKTHVSTQQGSLDLINFMLGKLGGRSGVGRGRAVYTLTGGLSRQMKPEARLWFTSRHLVGRVSRATLNTINEWPSRTRQSGSLVLVWVCVYELVMH